MTSRLAEGLVRRDRIEAADAVFVFASRVQEDGDPTTDAMSRLLKGIELVADGRSPRLVVSEVPPPAGPYAPLARAWVAAFAPRGEVVSVGRILNTREEAVAVARLFRERGWTRVLAVTSPTHTRRAAAALEKEGLVVLRGSRGGDPVRPGTAPLAGGPARGLRRHRPRARRAPRLPATGLDRLERGPRPRARPRAPSLRRRRIAPSPISSVLQLDLLRQDAAVGLGVALDLDPVADLHDLGKVSASFLRPRYRDASVVFTVRPATVTGLTLEIDCP